MSSDNSTDECSATSDVDADDILIVSSNAVSEDDRLYNEHQDFDDEKWLHAKLSKFKISNDENYKKGTLSCALCFTPVSFCYSSVGSHQYETKFIENCEIVKDTIQRDTVDDSIYHPVKCMECDLEIGLEDSDSIIHFFQVIAS